MAFAGCTGLHFQSPAWMPQQAETGTEHNPRRCPHSISGQILPLSHIAPLCDRHTAHRRRAAVIPPDPATPTIMGPHSIKGRRDGGEQPPPQRDNTELGTAWHISSTPATKSHAWRGFCWQSWVYQDREQREAPAPPSLCLSAEEFHLQGKPAPTQQLTDTGGERDAAPSSRRVRSPRMWQSIHESSFQAPPHLSQHPGAKTQEPAVLPQK